MSQTARIVPAFENSRHPDRTIRTVTELPRIVTDTPLVGSRSLGALLAFSSLAFKLETCQPTGSWLDRSAVAMVGQAVGEGATGVCLVEPGPLALPLAVQCARTGLKLVVLCPDQPEAVTRDNWLAALGARQIVAEANRAELWQAAGAIARRANLWLAGADDAPARAGLEAV